MSAFSSRAIRREVALALGKITKKQSLRLSSYRNMGTKLLPYHAPAWAQSLKKIPKCKVQLANPKTPIHEWKLRNIPEDFNIHIKRDDMTGSTLSGNKVRKLEFLLADAIDKGCGHVITCGGIQSNHCRATAVAAREMGLQPHLLLRSELKSEEEVGCDGNLLLDRLTGADFYMVPLSTPYETELKPRMEHLAAKIKEKTREDSYLIPVGGSNEVGLFGYISVFDELLSQDLHDRFDDIVFACGSGGTAAGIAISNYLTGGKVRCHAVIVCDNAAYFHDHTNQMLDLMGLSDVRSEDILDIIEGYKGRGYGKSTEEELEFIMDVGARTGIMIDPVYTGKAVRGLIQELKIQPNRFKGTRLLFIHTGGVYGLFDGRMNSVLKTRNTENSSKVYMWPTAEKDPT